MPRTYRTRPDPFEAVRDELRDWVEEEPDLTASEAMTRLEHDHRGMFDLSHLRTLQRRLSELRQREYVLESVRRLKNLFAVIGVREISKRGRHLHEGFDIEALAELCMLRTQATVEPVRILRDDRSYLAHTLDRCKRDHGVLCIGSSQSNPMTGYLVRHAFGLPSNDEPDPGSLPFGFCWARTERASCLAMSIEQVRSHDAALAAKVEGCELPPYVFMLRRRGDEPPAFWEVGQCAEEGDVTADFGVVLAAKLALRGRKRVTFLAAIGASGPGSWAACRLLVQGRIRAPIPEPPGVLYAPVRVDVGWYGDDREHGDVRRPRNPRLFGKPQIWLPPGT